MRFLFNINTTDYDDFLNQLNNLSKENIGEVFWQPKNSPINYLPVSYILIEKLLPCSDFKSISIHKSKIKGKFEILILNTPQIESEVPYYPIIIERLTTKIVGIMLPFNELNDVFTISEKKALSKLNNFYMKFILEYRFGKKS